METLADGNMIGSTSANFDMRKVLHVKNFVISGLEFFFFFLPGLCF